MSLRIHILLQQALIFIPQWRNRWRTLTAGSKRQIEQTLPRSHKCQFTGRSVGVRNGLNVLYSLVADNTDLCFYRVHVALLYCRTPLHWRLLAAGLCAYDAYTVTGNLLSQQTPCRAGVISTMLGHHRHVAGDDAIFTGVKLDRQRRR